MEHQHLEFGFAIADREIVLPVSVETIGDNAFEYCDKINGNDYKNNVTFPNGMNDELKADFENHKTDLWGADTITIIENGVSTTYTAS